MPATKIATCTYCGTRAALVLTGTRQHELACQACGAPLHDLKMLRSDAVDRGAPGIPTSQRMGARHGAHSHGWEDAAADILSRSMKSKRRRLAKKAIRGAFDVLGDLFD